MKVTIGNSATVAAQTNTLWNNNGGASLTNITYVTATIPYTATSTGNFYVGFNCYSIADQWAMQVDDILIEKVNPCSGTPTAGSAASSLNYICAPGNVNLSLTGSSTTTGLTYQWQSSPAGANTFTNLGASSSSFAYTATVSASTDYRCIVTCTAGGGNATSTATTVVLGSIPANDAVCNAITLVLDGPQDCGNTSCATATGDPAFTSSTPNNTIWYKYTPTVSGVINIEMSRPAGITTGFLNAWTGIYTATGTCPTLTLTQVTPAIAGYDLTTNPTVTVATGILTSGTTYYFMIDGNSGSFGAYCIKIKTPPAPPNCTTNITPSNLATNVSYLPNIKLKWNVASGANAYAFYFSTTNPPPTVLATVASDSILITGGAANTTYYWYAVPKGLGGSASGCTSSITSFTTSAPPPTPANNECINAITINANSPLNGTTYSATQSQAPDLCAGFTSTTAEDVWYKFTAALSGSATFSLTNANSTLDAVMIAYTGSCVSLTSLLCADATGGGGNETLNLSGIISGQTYYIRIYGYATTSGQGNFTLTASGSALPITLVYFSGVREGPRNILNWSTSNETNNKGFELERSANGEKFSSIASVNSKAENGNSSSVLYYTYHDEKPLVGTNYYRLRQIDFNGKESFSSIVVIKSASTTKAEITRVYPNPVEAQLNFVLNTPNSEKVNIRITDLVGKVISEKVLQTNQGDNNVQFNTSNLSRGTYLIRIHSSNNSELSIQKFIKH